jgi:pSer/pThr/pTyr-binding forkhead associated (FHA) protein
MPARLLSLDGQAPQGAMTLAAFPTLIGSAADAQIRLDDQSISPHHCEISYTHDTLFVRDLGSVHGTCVNGLRISESELHSGDELAIGMLTFLLKGCVDEAQTSSTPESRGESQV